MQICSLWCLYNASGAAGEAVRRMKHPALSLSMLLAEKTVSAQRVKHINHSEENSSEENSNAIFTFQKMAPEPAPVTQAEKT